jgi:F-type H+-transporting ATPase subunit delta
MAELATIARPYAEALVASGADATVVAQVAALGAVATNPELLQFAAHPKASADQVFGLVSGVAGASLAPAAGNLLRLVIENGRLAALSEIAAQAQALINARTGVAKALVQSAFPLSPEHVAEIQSALERRFSTRLDIETQHLPDLIGGVRVTVGDQVLDLSVQARLQQMKAALTA